jgi:hypothetical protein
MSPAADPRAARNEQVRRDALWAELKKAMPNGVEEIDCYAENQSLTEVCFSAGGQVYLFSLKAKRTEPLVFMKYLPRINRIEFGIEPPTRKDGQELVWYRLWANGQLEMSCLADK